jgi:hypothetical protein
MCILHFRTQEVPILRTQAERLRDPTIKPPQKGGGDFEIGCIAVLIQYSKDSEFFVESGRLHSRLHASGTIHCFGRAREEALISL